VNHDACLWQSEREKMNAKTMHQAFQQALCRLRLATAKSFVKTLTSGLGPGNIFSSKDVMTGIVTLASQ
jgi:hypothetical protein